MQPTTAEPPRPVENHLVWAVVSAFLFWPLAIPAIIHATRVDKLLAVGDHAGARRAASTARTWAVRATAVGIVWWVLSAACIPLAVVAAVDPVAAGSTLSDLLN